MDTYTERKETIDGIEFRHVREWGNYLLGNRYDEIGHAAHRNRGRNTGTKIHRLRTEYIVGLVDETRQEKPGTFGATFAKTHKPVLCSCAPSCGTTSGQHAGRPDSRLTREHVTCTKCA